MKLMFMTFFLCFGLYASSSPPESGVYRCLKGNDDTVCDQQIKVIKLSSGRVTGVRVYYEGYCNGQGPYLYGCEDSLCGDGIIKIEFINHARYRWENRNYNRYCEMELVGR